MLEAPVQGRSVASVKNAQEPGFPSLEGAGPSQKQGREHRSHGECDEEGGRKGRDKGEAQRLQQTTLEAW